MFNGIIKNQARLVKLSDYKMTLNFFDLSDDEIEKIKLGDSIACNGVCLTVTKIIDRDFYFDLAPETILKTNLTKIPINSNINIEFPMRIGDKIDGHLVYGHVYGVGQIVNISDNNIVRIRAEKDVVKYLDYKAPVTLNGIALTISDIFPENSEFAVNIIPFTWENTNLKSAKVGDLLNIEPDILAVYAIGINIRNAKNSS